MSYKITSEQLSPLIGDRADDWVDIMNQVFDEFDISTRDRVAMSLACWLYETGRLRHLRENMHYSAHGLRMVFPRYVTNDADAIALAKAGPDAIAERVYGDRMGNGPEGSGDGSRYIGRGFPHLTGKTNYQAAGIELGVNLKNDPELAETDPLIAARVGGWFWSSRDLNKEADNDDWESIVRKLNGAVNSPATRFVERTALLKSVYAALR